MVKADLGTKRVCPSCAARFYDLSKRPIECPKCSYSFEPEAMYKQRRPRQPEAVAAPVAREVDDDEEEEVAETDDDDAIVEKVENEPELVVGDEDGDDEVVVEEVEGAEAGMSVVSEDAVLDDIVDDVDDDDEGDDTLLEEVEEDEDDVSGIIDADIEKDER